MAWVVEVCGLLAVAVLLVGTYGLEARAVLAYPYFVPLTNLEESAYTHVAVRNFIHYGFMNSGFLQDVASSRYAEDHPFVYDHMPPGHEILLALISQLVGGSYGAVQLIWFTLAPAGLVVYILFLRRLFRPLDVAGAGFVAMFVSAWEYVTNSSHPHTSPFLLLAFGPLLLVARYEASKRVLSLALALGLLAIASLTLDYVLLSSVIASWVLLSWTGLWPLRWRVVVMACSVVVAGILLHLIQNALFLGGYVFGRELAYVVGNRVVGVPSSEALVSFYAESALLHHGARPLSVSNLTEVVKANLRYPGGRLIFAGAGCGILAFVALRRSGGRTRVRLVGEGRRAIRFFIRLGVWVGGVLLTPIVLFPALAQDMTLNGLVHSYFLAIPFLGATLWVAKAALVRARGSLRGIAALVWARGSLRGIEMLLKGRTVQTRWRAQAVLLACAALLTALGVSRMGKSQAATAAQIVEAYTAENPADSFRYLDELRRFNDGTFMTNINTPLVGFLTEQPGFGVCGLDSIDESGTPIVALCRIAMMRGYAKYLSVRPRYFFFFSSAGFFPGFATCSPLPGRDTRSGLAGEECHRRQRERLDQLFPVRFESVEVTVYDLGT